MTEQKTQKKTVFAIINLVNTQEQMQNTLMYASNLAKHLHLDLVVHPKHEETKYSFHEAGILLSAMTVNMGIKCRVSTQSPNFFTSINRIAFKHHAAFMVIGISEKITRREHKKEFSDTMWEVANHSQIPIYLVPKEAIFGQSSEITIPVDSSRTIQKATFLNKLTTRDTIVHLFIEQTTDPVKQKKIKWTKDVIVSYLSRHDIVYREEVAREETNYSQHLLRFAAKRSKLLIIEVESTIDSDLKQNLQTVLFGKHQQFAVLLIRTQDKTLTNWR